MSKERRIITTWRVGLQFDVSVASKKQLEQEVREMVDSVNVALAGCKGEPQLLFDPDFNPLEDISGTCETPP